MDRGRYGALVAAALALGLGNAAAQERAEPAGTAEPSEARSTSSGRAYRGVVPGSGHAPPKADAARSRKARLLTWPGFQMRPDGASRFFLQTSKPVEVQSKDADERRVELLLEDTRIHLRNNRRPLETRYFNTPVRRARIERRGSDVAIVLELRADVTPLVRGEDGEDGFHYVFVEFPPGDYVQADAAGAAADRDEPRGSVSTIR